MNNLNEVNKYHITNNHHIQISKADYLRLPESLPNKVGSDLHGQLYRVGSDASPIVATLYYKDGIFGYSNYLVQFIDDQETSSEKKD